MQCALHYSCVLPSCRALFVIHFNLPSVLLADDITLPEWPCWIWQIAVYVNWTRKAYCQCPFTFADVQHWNKCSIEFLNQTNICDPSSFVVHVVAVDYFCNLTMHNGHTGTKGHGRLKHVVMNQMWKQSTSWKELSGLDRKITGKTAMVWLREIIYGDEATSGLCSWVAGCLTAR